MTPLRGSPTWAGFSPSGRFAVVARDNDVQLVRLGADLELSVSPLGPGVDGAVDDEGVAAVAVDGVLRVRTGESVAQAPCPTPARLALGGDSVAAVARAGSGMSLAWFRVTGDAVTATGSAVVDLDELGGVAAGAGLTLIWGLSGADRTVALFPDGSPTPSWGGQGAPADWQAWSVTADGRLVAWGDSGLDVLDTAGAVLAHRPWSRMQRVAVSPGGTRVAWAASGWQDQPEVWIGDVETGAAAGPVALPLPGARVWTAVGDDGVATLAATTDAGLAFARVDPDGRIAVADLALTRP